MDIGQPGAVAGIDLGALSGSALAVEVAEVPRVYAATRLSAPHPDFGPFMCSCRCGRLRYIAGIVRTHARCPRETRAPFRSIGPRPVAVTVAVMREEATGTVPHRRLGPAGGSISTPSTRCRSAHGRPDRV